MKLDAFFAGMDGLLRGSSDAASTVNGFQGWDASPSRVAIYGRFVRGHVRDTVEKLYPFTREAIGGDRWGALVERYFATHPARHFEINRIGESFPTFLGDEGVQPWIVELARFEWTDFAVYAATDEIPASVQTLSLNPTVQVLEGSFRIAKFLATKPRPAEPEAGAEIALLWRHPVSGLTTFSAADDRSLLLIKMALEGVSVADAAAAGGVPVEEIEKAVRLYARDGLVITAPSGG